MKKLSCLIIVVLFVAVLLSGCGGGGGSLPTQPGFPIVDLTWTDVTGTSIQAEPNYGYIADNASQVMITLPSSLSIGDIVAVTGAGTGGWKIAQNAGQTVVTKNIETVSNAWTLTSASTATFWQSVASSADGTKLVAVAGGGIYTSSDSGSTWTLTSAPATTDWYSVASSSDGTKLVAVVRGGGIYTSSNAGVTWTLTSAPIAYWLSVASSSDGTKLVAVGGNAIGIYTSSNAGVTWTLTSAPTTFWYSVASSSDGTKLVAVGDGGLYTSSDSGGTWTPQTSGLPTSVSWPSVASSSDGTKLVAVASIGGIYTSSNSGVTWTLTSAPTNTSWTTVASSSDGTKLVAAIFAPGPPVQGAISVSQIYTSSDSGITWTQTSAPTHTRWTSVASSSDGIKLVAVAGGGGIYTLTMVHQSTTVGLAGSISGGQYDAVSLQYIGNNTFTVLSNEGHLVVQ